MRRRRGLLLADIGLDRGLHAQARAEGTSAKSNQARKGETKRGQLKNLRTVRLEMQPLSGIPYLVPFSYLLLGT